MVTPRGQVWRPPEGNSKFSQGTHWVGYVLFNVPNRPRQLKETFNDSFFRKGPKSGFWGFKPTWGCRILLYIKFLIDHGITKV